MIDFFKHPLFLLGLLLRLTLIFFIASEAVTAWYLPFMNLSISEFTFDPWATWLGQGGDPAAFPYGYAMWLILLPVNIVLGLTNIPLIYSYFFTLLLVDTMLLLLLNELIEKRKLFLIIGYWLSPVVIIASYGLGLNDLIPTLLLMAAILKIQQIKIFQSGLLLSLAISAKFSMVMTLPFFLIYLFNKKAFRKYIPEFLKAILIILFVLGIPFFLSDGALQMLSSNSELEKIYLLSINLGGNSSVFLIPLTYALLLYSIWRIKRLNFNLFVSTTGLSFLLIVLMTPASPGWFIWIVPFLVFYQSQSDKASIFLVTLFSILYGLSILFLNPLSLYSGDPLISFSPDKFIPNFLSLLQTLVIALGFLIFIRIFRESISGDDFFRQSRKPFVIGIAGDSGSGKDTLADAISTLFGTHSVAHHSGDDYHLWDRQKPIWQFTTHLNPKANDLERFGDDLIALIDGKAIQARHYDHQSGRLSRLIPIKSNDFIIASGLHALYLKTIRDAYNLKIFLDMDEDLRREFKLERDVVNRGHTKEAVMESMQKRQQDSQKFIKGQSSFADLVFSLKNSSKLSFDDMFKKNLNLQLGVSSRTGFNELSLYRVLVGICGLHVDLQVQSDTSETTLIIDGEISAADISLAAELLCPNIIEFLDISPCWSYNTIGLMQLITLCHIDQALNRKFTK